MVENVETQEELLEESLIYYNSATGEQVVDCRKNATIPPGYQENPVSA